MRKYSAHYVFPLVSNPLKNGIVVIDDNGFFKELIDTEGKVEEISRLEFHSGIMIPEIKNLSVSNILDLQNEKPKLSLNEILKLIASGKEIGFVAGEKASLFLISPLDLANLKLSAKSKLKKLV